jgi:hypothetical protein
LGGIVCRYYAHHAGDARVVQTISIASPFAGVPSARYVGLHDLSPESALLRRIRIDAARFSHVPHLSIIAGSDHVVGSPVSHALPGGDVVVIADCGHNTLLFDDGVAQRVAERVLAQRATTVPHASTRPVRPVGG